MVTMYCVSLRNQNDLGLIDSAFTKGNQLNPVDLAEQKLKFSTTEKVPKYQMLSNPAQVSFTKYVSAVGVNQSLRKLCTTQPVCGNLRARGILLQEVESSVYQEHHILLSKVLKTNPSNSN